VVKETATKGGFVTTQGARTGITASAVPDGGLILNLSRMKQVGGFRRDESTGKSFLSVEPGVLLDEIRDVVQSKNLFFPPDPTESSASIGGMVACNASGAMSFYYGSTRRWINALRVVLSDGSVIELKRGEQMSVGRSFTLTTTCGRVITGTLPSYILPDVKNAAGYYVAENMDMIDLFIGMEGTLGVITQIEVKLIKKPSAVLALTAFLPSEESAIMFVRKLRFSQDSSARLVALEFFNNGALNLLRTARETHAAFSDLPALPQKFNSAVYVEFHGDDEDVLDEKIMVVAELIAELGGSEDDCWCATTSQELEKLHLFRHATPELVNLKIDQRRKIQPELTKLGTDMSVPDCELENVMSIYNAGLKAINLEYVIFGHIGNNHVHVNIIPKNMEEYAAGKKLYLDWAQQIVGLGGSVSAEHGIGKIKVPFLKLMYGEAHVAEMKNLKLLFDPNGILNPGNLF
jgi:D-lactate dehydrogenase (cytochrome)